MMIVHLIALNADELIRVLDILIVPTQKLIERVGGGLLATDDGKAALVRFAAANPDGASALQRPLARLVERALATKRTAITLDRDLAMQLCAGNVHA
jgi:hypothetical protein